MLTSLPIDTVDQVRLVIQYYSTRWMVEIFFRVLKIGMPGGGSTVRGHATRLLPCLAVYLIVAWRVLYVCRLGRSCPEISCEAVFEPAEWQSVYRGGAAGSRRRRWRRGCRRWYGWWRNWGVT